MLSDHEYLSLHGMQTDDDVALECFELREQVQDLTRERDRLAAEVKALRARPADDEAGKRNIASLFAELDRERSVTRAAIKRNTILSDKLRALGA